MSDAYYNRTGSVHTDGTRIFQTSADRQAEAEVAALLAQRWGCEIRSFGALAAVDWFAVRHGRPVAVIELKTSLRASTDFPWVLLNTRKWDALGRHACGLNVPAYFVIKLADGLFWIPLSKIDPSDGRTVFGGCMKMVKSINDIELIIRIPVTELHRIREAV